MHRARGARAARACGFDSLPSLSDVWTFSFRWILPFWYFCFLLGDKARLALSPKRKQKYQNGNIHRKLKVLTSVILPHQKHSTKFSTPPGTQAVARRAFSLHRSTAAGRGQVWKCVCILVSTMLNQYLHTQSVLVWTHSRFLKPLLYLLVSGATAACTLPRVQTLVKWTPLLHRIGEGEVHIRFQWWARTTRALLCPCLSHIYGFIKFFLKTLMQRVVRPQKTVSVIMNSYSERVADSLFAFEKYSSAAIAVPPSYSPIYKNTLEYYNVQFPSDRILRECPWVKW